MSQAALDPPQASTSQGHPVAAARLRGAMGHLPRIALEAALRLDPTFRDRHDDLMLRRFLRDYDRHIEQLARAVASGEDRYVVVYGEGTVPAYRRRRVRMNDVVTLLRGLEEAAVSAGPAADADAIRRPMAAWIERMRRHRRLAGDHAGNKAARFIWKGAGLGDDTVV
jgi:hypothetical protein